MRRDEDDPITTTVKSAQGLKEETITTIKSDPGRGEETTMMTPIQKQLQGPDKQASRSSLIAALERPREKPKVSREYSLSRETDVSGRRWFKRPQRKTIWPKEVQGLEPMIKSSVRLKHSVSNFFFIFSLYY